MLQNAYLLAKIGADTAENERKFAENLPEPEISNYPTGRARRCRVGDGPAARAGERPGDRPGERTGDGR